MSAFPQIDGPEEIGKAYQCMVKTYGKEILREPRRAVGALADIAPKMSGEINALKVALQEKIPMLLESDRSGKKAQTENGKRAVELLKKKGLTEDEAFSVVENLGAVLGIDMDIRTDYTKGGSIPYADLPKGATLQEAMDALNHIRWFLNHENEYVWKKNNGSLTELRRLLNRPKKNKDQIEAAYKKIVQKFINNPYKNNILLKDSQNGGDFVTERFEDYFLDIDDNPVPVGFAKQYLGANTDKVLLKFSLRKRLFLDDVKEMEKKYKNYKKSRASDEKRLSTFYAAGLKFMFFSIVLLAVFGFLLKDIVLHVDFGLMLKMMKSYHYNLLELVRSYSNTNYVERYFAGWILVVIMLPFAVLQIVNTLYMAVKCGKLKRAIRPFKKLDKAIAILEKEIPEKAEAMEKLIKEYWNSGKNAPLFKKYDYISVLKYEARDKVSTTNPVKKRSKRLSVLMIGFCVLLFAANQSGFAGDMVMGSQMMGGVPIAENIMELGDKTINGSGKSAHALWEADVSELDGISRVNIADCSQSSYLTTVSAVDYTARAAMDQSDQTSWQEGVEGNGEGESIWFALDQSYEIQYFTFKLGSWKTDEAFVENGRPETMTIQVGDISATYVFPDEKREFVLKLDKPLTGANVKFTVDSVYTGSKMSDTCITDVGIYGISQNEASAKETEAVQDTKQEEAAVQMDEELIEQVSWTGNITYDQQSNLLSAGTVLEQDKMVPYLHSNAATRAVYVLDMERMQEYGVENSDTPMPASALIGIPILFTIANEVEDGNIGINDAVTFSYTFEGGRGNLKSSQAGQTFALGDMLREAFRYSDNNAFNSLIDFLGLERINRVCHEKGFQSVDMQMKLQSASTNQENYISAKDAAMMVNAIYQNNYSEINRAFLEDNFYIIPTDASNTGMYSVGQNYMEFLNLNGVRDTRYNEVGLFAEDSHAFIISVLTCDGKLSNSVSMVRDLSGYIVPALMGK